MKNLIHIFLESILNDVNKFPSSLEYKKIDLLSLSEWKIKIKKGPDFPFKSGEAI